MHRRSAAITVPALCALALGGAGAAAASSATTSAGGATFTACVSHVSGSFYNLTVSPARDRTCRSGDVRVRWNQKGVPGLTGARGATGAPGARGAAGTDGTNGQDGRDGTDGIDGTNGVDGTNGQDGRDGIDGTNGVDGTNGTNGQDGRDGIDGTDGVDGTDGADGQGFVFVNSYDDQQVYRVGDVVSVDGSSYVSLVGLNLGHDPATDDGQDWALLAARGQRGGQGIQGEEGEQGDTGATGAAGADGEAGPAGADGATGADGANGMDGADGAQGPQGLPGAQGVKGDTGAGFLFRADWMLEGTYAVGDVVALDGSSYLSLVDDNTGHDPASDSVRWGVLAARGTQGDPGATGATGAAGPAGPAGETGATGTDGATGPQGPQGPQGAPGERGDAGATGATGATGPSVASSRTLADATIAVEDSSSVSQNVTCPAGLVAIGAGWESTAVTIRASYPLASDAGTWRFTFVNAYAATSVKVHVICIG
ncbi:MAG TPA: hypothetical protein VFL59_14640 [Candidatus Nanopelagicales bacterium]|nr:hypothetical protein [Candidatus Nanopelagicales bacterium]